MANKNILSQIELTSLNKNMFDLSHEHKLSCNMASLVPVCIIEAVPTDKVFISQEALVRLAPMVAPIMHRVDVTFHTFFVPNRLVWEKFPEFIMNKPVSGTVPTHPFIKILPDSSNYTTLMNYFGIPRPSLNPGSTQFEPVNAIPFAAYQMIYDEYYRDQNVVPDPINYKLSDGDNTADVVALCTMRNRAWEHDYFTSALPTAQFGSPVTLPLVGFNDVQVYSDTAAGTRTITPSAGNTTNLPVEGKLSPTFPGASQTLYADTSELGANQTTVTDLRIAFRLQEWAEKMMRGGRRFVEYLGVMFGVRNLDARLQRPEYITGSKSPVVVSEVLNTTGTVDAPQGNMAGHGISVVSSNAGGYYAPEHGFIITIMSVMPKTGYQQGLAKFWLKKTFTDYFTPQFANVGEQEIELRELFSYTAAGGDTFGYTPRYSEYKYAPNRVSGEFQNTLDFWHLGRKFQTPPALNQDFIECTADQTMRIFAVSDPADDHLWIQIYNKVKAIRPMPIFGTPSI